MSRLRVWMVVLAVLWPVMASAQQEVDASVLYLGVSGSVSRLTTGSGSPEGVVAGPVGARYIDVTTGLSWRKASGTSTTGWVATLSLAPCGTAGMFLRSTGSAWGCSTLVLPNAATSTRLVYATATNTYGESADLTFSGGTTLAAPIVSASTRVTTPLVFGTPSLSVGGTGVAACTTTDPLTTSNCEAAQLVVNTSFLEQRSATNLAVRSRWSFAESGVIVNAFNASVFLPLRLEGAPVQIRRGGLHLGGTANVSDAGEGNGYIEGWLRSVSPSYSSQTSGMQIDFGTGSIDARFLYANELQAKNFIADLQTALAGSQIVAKSVAVVSRDFSVPAGGSVSTLYVRDLPSANNMAVFESGDAVRLRQFSRASGSLTVTDAYGIVTNYVDLDDGEQSWTFTRSLSPCSGGASTGAIIPAESLALDYGVSGNGAIETNAIDGVYGINSPYVKAVTRGTCAGDQTTRAKLGNLRGDTGTTEYGLLAGTFGATSSGRYILFSDQRATIHNVPLSLYSGSNLTLYMNPVLSSFSQATSSADTMTYGTGTGCWSGIDAGAFKWRCGIPGGQGIFWNGTTLNVNGNITVTGVVAEDTNNVDGVPAADVASGAARALLGLTADANPALPAVATPSGSGLFLGSDYMGYYASGAWQTFMQSNGNFYLGGTGGNLQWVAATSTLTISATLAGNGSAITSISGGNITTGSITATQIAAGTITATQIAADTITASQIAANAITTSELSANSVTSAKIAAGTIVAANIAAGTITANEIAAATITAGKLDVSELSAITANLGSVTINTAGYLASGASNYSTGTGFWLSHNGGTPQMRIGDPDGSRVQWSGTGLDIYGAGYQLSDDYGLGFQNSSGVSDYQNLVWWQSGAAVGSTADRMSLWGPNGAMAVAVYEPFIDFQTVSGPTSIASIHANGEVWVGDGGGTGWLFLQDVSGTDDDESQPLVIGTSREVRYRTDTWNGGSGCGAGEFVLDVTAKYGIVTSITCAAPFQMGVASIEDVDRLRQEVAELRAQMARLLGRDGRQ